MCRMVVFIGACTRCGESQTWDELAQKLSCLEAKNNCAFGDCSGGVHEERHDFDQECDRCAEEDEGIGDVGDEAEEAGAEKGAPAAGKRVAADDSDGDDPVSREAKKQKT